VPPCSSGRTGSGGNLSGTCTESDVTGTAPTEQVSSKNGNLTGTLNGGTLTLNVPQSDGSFQAASCTSGTLTQATTRPAGATPRRVMATRLAGIRTPWAGTRTR
jgi:hypothetical protein